MRRYIDLHMHTNISDGTKTPSELLNIVRKSNIEVFSVTDHDTIDGYFEVKRLLTGEDPILISGLEISTYYEGQDMHILAYLFDPDHKPLQTALKEFQEHRNSRGKKIVDKLNEMGVGITFDDVMREANDSVVGRPHIAEAMMKGGHVSYFEEAFEKYIGNKAPAYVKKKNFTPEEAIALIHQAGGIAVLAHPMIDNNDRHIEQLLGVGLDGIEVYHSSHKQPQVDRLLHLAERFRIVATGGSDYHGRTDSHGYVGSQKVPYRLYEKLVETKEKRRG